MNILVIGGNGFIGSHLIDYLLLKGHNVRVFDLYKERYREPLANVDYRISNLENILNKDGVIIFFHGENLDLTTLIEGTGLNIMEERKFGKSFFTILSS